MLDIISAIDGFITGNSFVRWITDFLSIIPKIMYFIVTCILSVIDLFQVMFRKLAGLDPIIISGETTTGDSIYQIITDALFTGKYPALNIAFWSIIILGVFMLIVASIVATIRIEYNPDKDKGNSKSGIIRSFFKALFSFAIIPIASIFGMALANSLIGVIDTVTTVEIEQNDSTYIYFDQWQGVSGTDQNNVLVNVKSAYTAYDVFGITIPTTAEPFSGIMFKASAYSSNRFRRNGNDYLAAISASGTDLGIFSTGQVGDYQTAADIIDTGFAINAKLKGGPYKLIYSDAVEEFASEGFLNIFGTTKNITNFSKYNVSLVWYFYDLWTFNYIVAFVAIIIVGKLYFQFCLALMARLFEIAGLFLLVPIPIAIMPIDGGGALSRWRGVFVAKYCLMLVMIFGLNIISPILTIMQSVKLFNLPILDYIVLTMFLVAALSAVNSMNSTISKIIFDKNSDYDSALKGAEGTVSSLKAGLNATKSAFGVASAVPKLAAKTAVGAAAWGYNRYNTSRNNRINSAESNDLAALNQHAAIQNDSYDRDELNEIKSNIDYDPAVGVSNYELMTEENRGKMADDFLNTTQGRQFAADNFGGNTALARAAIELNDFTGFGNEDALRGTVAQFAHDREKFALTSEAAGLTEGSAAYRQALSKYANSSLDEKAEKFLGGAPLTARQKSIQAQRDAFQKTVSAQESSIRATYDAERKKANALKNKVNEVKQDFATNVAPKIAKANEYIKPHISAASSGIRSLVGLIPGSEFFSKPKDK